MLISLFYVVVPLILIGTVAAKRQPNTVFWLLTAIVFGSIMTYLWATVRWEMVSIYLRPLFPVLFLIAVVISYRRIRKPVSKPTKMVVVLEAGIYMILLVIFSGLNWFTFKGYSIPDDTIDLASPFRHGKQIVLHGGASPFTNGHFHVKPQNHALDIVGLNALGMRSTTFVGGENLENYAIFGEQVYSPIDGTISVVVDKFDDQNPPITDVGHLAGNHILIVSGGVEVLLAHLKKGSVLVNEGDYVTTNTPLGKVGNTGNTSEPHLHLHVESGGIPKTILNGTAVPFTINGRYLVRGDVLNHTAPQVEDR